MLGRRDRVQEGPQEIQSRSQKFSSGISECRPDLHSVGSSGKENRGEKGEKTSTNHWSTWGKNLLHAHVDSWRWWCKISCNCCLQNVKQNRKNPFTCFEKVQHSWKCYRDGISQWLVDERTWWRVHSPNVSWKPRRSNIPPAGPRSGAHKKYGSCSLKKEKCHSNFRSKL